MTIENTNKDNSKNNMGVDGDELTGFVTLDGKEVYVPEGRFRPLNEKKVLEIAESIEKHGQLQPILVDEMGNLIFGNHRLHACIHLGILVEAKITQEKNPDKIALMEIDENLMRKGLSATETENHLAERKRIYNNLYPNTAKRGAKSKEDDGKKSFAEDTAEATGKSARTVERIVKRGEDASDELQEARDNKKISTADVDTIIKDVGSDKDKQMDAMKEIIKQKALKKDAKKKQDDPLPAIVENSYSLEEEIGILKDIIKSLETKNNSLEEENKNLVDTIIGTEVKIESLKDENNSLKDEIERVKASNQRYKDRIAKAKSANTGIKI